MRVFTPKATGTIIFLSLLGIGLFGAGCGTDKSVCADGTVSVNCPFVFPPTGAGGPNPSITPNLCENITCANGEVCDVADGRCKPTGPIGHGAGTCQQDSDCLNNKKCQNNQCVTQTTPGCTADSNCSSGQVCKNSACVAGCRSNADCTSDQTCNTSSKQCVPRPPTGCTSDANCPSGQVCQNNSCVTRPAGCTTDGNCPAGQVCKDSACVAGCRSNADCTSSQTCDTSSKQCIPRPPICTTDGACPAGQVCKDSACVAGCRSNTDCTSDQTCDTTTKQCVPRPPTGCTSDATCPAGQVCEDRSCITGCHRNGDCTGVQICNATTHLCENPPSTCNITSCEPGQTLNLAQCRCDSIAAGTCEAEFLATISLRADSPVSDKFNIPAACFYYGLDPDSSIHVSPYQSDEGQCAPGPNTGPNGEDLSNNDRCHNDLVCCTGDSIPTTDPAHHAIACDPPERIIDQDAHGKILAVTRWPAYPPQSPTPIKVLFNVDPVTGACRWTIPASEFPQFRLQNSGLQASLIIDAGGRTHEAGLFGPDAELAALNAQGSCTPTTLTDGTPGIAITTDEGSGLRFRIQFFQNTIEHPNPAGDFQEPFPGGAAQIIPPLTLGGIAQPPLQFTTATATAQPAADVELVQPDDPLLPLYEVETLSSPPGVPLHAVSDTQSEMTIVTAVTIPNQPSSFPDGSPNPESGLLVTQIGGAPLTAEIAGTIVRVSKRDQSIRSIEDLNPTNCGNIPPPPQKKLFLSAQSNFDGTTTILSLPGDPLHPENGFFTPTPICATGTAAGEGCDPLMIANLPYAKDLPEQVRPPSVLILDRFRRDGFVTLASDPESTETINFNVTERHGAFRVTNFASLQPLAPGGHATIQIRFEPEIAGLGGETPPCTVNNATGLAECETDIVLSDAPSPPLRIRVMGHARIPAADLKITEINVESPDSPGTELDLSQPIQFPDDAIVGGKPKTKLFRISNAGVRDLAIRDIVTTDDNSLYFRGGATYRGTSFNSRTWISDQPHPWVVPPAGISDLFFFENYGPFGKVTEGDAERTHCETSHRCDSGHLTITTTAETEPPPPIVLSGKAIEDNRAVLTVFVQDESRASVLPASDHSFTTYNDPNDTPDLGDLHLFEILVRDTAPEFSLRQDDAERVVYVKNGGDGSRIDNLRIRRIDFVNDTRFTFTLNPDLTAAYGSEGTGGTCVRATDPDLSTCLSLTPTAANQKKIGTIRFNPNPDGTPASTYSVFSKQLMVTAESVRSSDGHVESPITGAYRLPTGDFNRSQAAGQVAYTFKGAAGAPSGLTPLRIHRMFAGFNSKITDTQRSKIVSTSTRGIVDRSNSRGSSDRRDVPAGTNLEDLIDLFTISGTIRPGEDHAGMMDLNPQTGAATFRGLFTPVEPASQTPSQRLNGLRIYSGPGLEIPAGTEYYFQCLSAHANCPFFYIYVGDWATTQTTASAVPGASDICPTGKYAIAAIPQGIRANPADPTAVNWLDPQVPAERDCMRASNVIKDSTDGLYDPVTGEVTFKKLAIRLFSPVTLSLGEVDSTLQLSLTTECVTPDRIPDTAARPGIVPHTRSDDTLNETDFDRTLMTPPGVSWTNPLQPYVNGGCGEGVLHGRRLPVTDVGGSLLNLDDTMTLDNDGTPAVGPFNFDLAGVAKITSALPQVNGKLMYIIIKVEVSNSF